MSLVLFGSVSQCCDATSILDGIINFWTSGPSRPWKVGKDTPRWSTGGFNFFWKCFSQHLDPWTELKPGGRSMTNLFQVVTPPRGSPAGPEKCRRCWKHNLDTWVSIWLHLRWTLKHRLRTKGFEKPPRFQVWNKTKILTDVFFFKSQVEFCSPQKIVGGGGEKSGSLTRSKIAAGRTLPDYSWSAIWFFWRSSIAVIYSLVQIFRPILILEPQSLFITLPDYSWSVLWPIAVSSYISGTGAESC